MKLSEDFNGADLRNVCTEAGESGVTNICLTFSSRDISSFLRMYFAGRCLASVMTCLYSMREFSSGENHSIRDLYSIVGPVIE